MVAALRVGQLIIREEGGEEQRVAISGGFTEVLGDKVTVLAETAEFRDDVDVARAGAARDRATQRLTRPIASDIDVARAEGALGRALNRLRLAG